MTAPERVLSTSGARLKACGSPWRVRRARPRADKKGRNHGRLQVLQRWVLLRPSGPPSTVRKVGRGLPEVPVLELQLFESGMAARGERALQSMTSIWRVEALQAFELRPVRADAARAPRAQPAPAYSRDQ